MTNGRRPSAPHVVERVAVAACGFCLFNWAGANPPARLDLRAPANCPPALPPSGIREFASAYSPNERIHSSDLSIDRTDLRVTSNSAIFVDRVRREGLPFARLWESRSALLSIGLSPKGKPGLWLTQKIR
jgi:hypothetical protein